MFKRIVFALFSVVLAYTNFAYAVDSISVIPGVPVTVSTEGSRWTHIVTPDKEGYVMFNMNDTKNRQNAFVVAGVRPVFTKNLVGIYKDKDIESWVLGSRIPDYLKIYADGVYQASAPVVEAVTVGNLNWKIFHYKVHIRGHARSVSFFLAEAGDVVLQGWVNSGNAFYDLKEGKVVQQFLAGIKLSAPPQ